MSAEFFSTSTSGRRIMATAVGLSASIALVAGCSGSANSNVAKVTGEASHTTTTASTIASPRQSASAHTGDAALCAATSSGVHHAFADIASLDGKADAAVTATLNSDQRAVSSDDQSDNGSPVVQALGALSQALTDVAGQYAGALGQTPPSTPDPVITARIQTLTTAVAGVCADAGVSVVL